MAALSAKSFWYDEAFTALVLDHDFGGMLAAIPETERTPPLYYVLAWGWTRIFGLGEAGVRSFSALVGIALIVVAYCAGRELFSRRVGIVAAALVATNPFLIWYSQEARAYALLALLGGLSFLFFLRARAGKEHALPWWSAMSALALLTHYYAVFLVAAEAACLLLARERHRAVVLALLPSVAVGAGLLPLVIDHDGQDFSSALPLLERLADVGRYLVGNQVELWLAAVPILACLVALWLLFRRTRPAYRQRALFVAGVGAAAVSSAVLLSLAGVDFFMPRNFIWVILPMVLVIAAGLGPPEAGRVGPAVALAACLLSTAIVVATAQEPKYEEDWRGAAEAIGDDAPQGRAILLMRNHGNAPLMAYLDVKLLPATGTLRELVLLGPADLAFDVGPPDPDPRFDRVETVATDYFRLIRFRAAEPVLVERKELRRGLEPKQVFAFLVQR